jgi:hypothetical protein
MNIREIIVEARYSSTIVVDVQPAYSRFIKFTPELMQFLNTQKRILMLVNSDEEGYTNDSITDIKEYWESNGFANWNAVKLIDKGYGYLRSWMDQGIPENIIIKTIREMYQQRVNDSRVLFQHNENPEEDFKKFIGFNFEDWMLDDSISVDWISLKLLKSFSGSYITGGGCNECLKEVELLMSAFNIRSKRISKFIF